MFYNLTSNLADINLNLYEILFTEPLHGLSNHIQNLYAELPFQIEKEYRKSFADIINIFFYGKIATNSSDYRKSILKSDSHLPKKIVLFALLKAL